MSFVVVVLVVLSWANMAKEPRAMDRPNIRLINFFIKVISF